MNAPRYTMQQHLDAIEQARPGPVYVVQPAPTGWKSVPWIIRAIAWLVALTLALPILLSLLYLAGVGVALAWLL
ncbi:MAG: hypothetical protein ACRC1H_03990 [Caldilineaceae bacterium]